MELVIIQMKSKTYILEIIIWTFIYWVSPLIFPSNFVKFIFVGMGDYDEGEKNTIHFSWFLKQ